MFPGKRPFLRPILLIFLAAFFLTGCATADNTNWPGLSTDGDTVYVAAGSQVLAYDAATQQLQWAFPEEAGTVQFYADPSVANGRLVIGDYGVPGGFFNPSITVTLYGVDVSGP